MNFLAAKRRYFDVLRLYTLICRIQTLLKMPYVERLTLFTQLAL